MKLIGLRLVLCASAWQLPFASADDREDREHAVAAIQKLGGKVEVDATDPGRPVVKVSFRNTKITDEGLSHLKPLTSKNWTSATPISRVRVCSTSAG
jgi:hypothetical protein